MRIKHMQKGFSPVFIMTGILVVLVILAVPLPGYRSKEVCMESDPPICQAKKGWYLNIPLYQQLFFVGQTVRQIVEEIPVCQVDADCVVAIEVGSACSCPKVASKDQLQRNKNLVPYEEGKDYSRPNSRVACEPCPGPPEAVICDMGPSVNSCRGASKAEAELSYEARKAVNLAKADLAKNLNIDIRKIVLNRVQEVTWPDSSMGCSKPEEGVSLPVVTPGYQIFLQAYGVIYDYRAGKGGEQGYYIRPCSTQLAIDCTEDSDCSQGLVCVGRGPAQPSKEIPGVCVSEKQSQGVQ